MKRLCTFRTFKISDGHKRPLERGMEMPRSLHVSIADNIRIHHQQSSQH